MREFLHGLQNKPPSAKKRWAFGISIVSTGLIFILWLSLFSVSFTTRENKTAERPFDRYGALASVYFNIKRGVVFIAAEARAFIRN